MLSIAYRRPLRVAMAFALLVAALVTLFLTNRPPLPKRSIPPVEEQWVPDLARVQSMDAAMPIVRNYIAKQQGTREERIAKGVDEFVRDRFVHGFSYTPPNDDWLLNFIEAMAKRDLTVPVKPDDILKHRRAMCSQQSIIFMELLRRFNMEFGAVLMSWPDADRYNRGHFAVAAKVDGKWRYFDSNIEAATAPLVSQVIDGTAVADLYPTKPLMVKRLQYAAAHGRIRLDHVNDYPAPRGLAMQETTRFLSTSTPFFLSLFGLLILFSRNAYLRTQRKINVRDTGAFRQII
jgi:hypothetical protein